MGKGVASRHQRFVKAEKGKIKLKGKKESKKELPKGTNVTRTDFKIKKIVLRDQVKSSDGTEPLSKTKLNVKELITRLGHFNTNARNEALNGLKELVAAYQNEVLSNNLGQLVKGVSPLILDRERSVRRESYKVLHVILSPLSLEKIIPFFDIMCSYLRCAMTHIDTAIHEDSLLFFDVLLLCAPSLVAKNLHKILPSFLDMISKMRLDSKPGRTLVVNLGSKMTSIKWRTKVLSRLHLLLQTLNDIKIRQKQTNLENFANSAHRIGRTEVFNPNNSPYFPVYRNITFAKLPLFSRDKSNSEDGDNEALKLQSYISTLTPLLFETWLEVKPSDSKTAKRVESVISEEAALLLRSILQIISLLWSLSCLVESEEKNVELTAWFVELYQHNFSQHFYNSFPYIQGKTARKKGDVAKTTDNKCVEENLLLCHLYVIIHSKSPVSSLQYNSDSLYEYMLDMTEHISTKGTNSQSMYANVLQELFKSASWTKLPKTFKLLEAIIQLYNREKYDSLLKESIFSLLTTIVLENRLAVLRDSKHFQLWLTELPKVICDNDFITSASFDVIYHLAIRDNKLFNNSIKGKLKNFLQRIPSIRIIGLSEVDTKERLINLLFWVKPWDTESLNLLQDQLGSQCYDTNMKEYLVDLLKIKTDGMFSAE